MARTRVRPTDPFAVLTSRMRMLGVGGAIASAALYLLIGLGVLSIGDSTATGQTTDLLAFGAVMAAVYGSLAVGLWRLHSRVVLGLIAAFQLIPILGYVAFAGLREPPFDLWGVLIKVAQVGVLVGAAVLALNVDRGEAAVGQPKPKGHPA